MDDAQSIETQVAAPLTQAELDVLTDKLIAASRPLDMTGADEIEEVSEEEKAND